MLQFINKVSIQSQHPTTYQRTRVKVVDAGSSA